jgi:hypothetical protein
MENGDLSKEKSKFRHVDSKRQGLTSNCLMKIHPVLRGKAESCIVKEASATDP